jgi:hypothetical protein
LLMFQREAEMVLVEGGSPGDICYLVAHAMDTERPMWLSTLVFIRHCRASSLCVRPSQVPPAARSRFTLFRNTRDSDGNARKKDVQRLHSSDRNHRGIGKN